MTEPTPKSDGCQRFRVEALAPDLGYGVDDSELSQRRDKVL